MKRNCAMRNVANPSQSVLQLGPIRNTLQPSRKSEAHPIYRIRKCKYGNSALQDARCGPSRTILPYTARRYTCNSPKTPHSNSQFFSCSHQILGLTSVHKLVATHHSYYLSTAPQSDVQYHITFARLGREGSRALSLTDMVPSCDINTIQHRPPRMDPTSHPARVQC